MSTAQLTAVRYLARYTGCTYALYASQLASVAHLAREDGIKPLVGLRRGDA